MTNLEIGVAGIAIALALIALDIQEASSGRQPDRFEVRRVHVPAAGYIFKHEDTRFDVQRDITVGAKVQGVSWCTTWIVRVDVVVRAGVQAGHCDRVGTFAQVDVDRLQITVSQADRVGHVVEEIRGH